jgi:hypothetical protein
MFRYIVSVENSWLAVQSTTPTRELERKLSASSDVGLVRTGPPSLGPAPRAQTMRLMPRATWLKLYISPHFYRPIGTAIGRWSRFT